jgi:hypothetical protein
VELISSRVGLPPGPLASDIRQVLGTIDGIHKTPGLPAFEVRWTQTVNPSARFWPPINGNPARIDLSELAHTPRLSFLHEVGHLLDHYIGQGKGYYASAGNSPLTAVINQAQQSFAYNDLYDAAENLPLWQKSFIRGYLLSPEELWARAYAQFITIRSGDATLLQELNSARGEPDFNQFRQWSDTDFVPVAVQIERAFVKLGWMQ